MSTTIAAPAAVSTTTEAGAERARPSLARGGVGLGIAALVASGVNYASNVVLGRGLEARAFADAALVVSGLLLLSAVAVGFQLSVARQLAAGGGAPAARLIRRRALTIGGAVGLALAAMSPLIAAAFHMGSYVPIVVIAPGVPLFFVLAVRRGVLQASHRFGRLGASQVVEPVTRLLVTMLALSVGLGPTSAAIGLVLALAAGLAVTAVPDTIDRDDRATAEVRSARAATLLLLTGQVVIANGDLWVVSAFAPDDAGGYAAIALVGRLVFIAAWSIVTVVFPSLVAGEREASAALLRRAVAATAAAGGALTALAVAFGDRVLDAMVGGEFSGAAHLLSPYALATTLFVMANLLAVADLASARATLPAVMTLGAFVQTASLIAVAPQGVEWVVWTQVVVMAMLFAALATATAVRSARPARVRPGPT